MSDLRKRVQEEIDWTTRHWSSYLRDYNRYAEPRSTYNNYVNDIYQPVRRLWRSASSSSLSSQKDLIYGKGSLRRTASYSSLAPSNAIRFRERSVERYVPRFRAYAPKGDEWRQEQSAYQRSVSFTRSLHEKSASRSSGFSTPYSSGIYSPLSSSYSSIYGRDYGRFYPNYSSTFRQRFTKPTSWGRLEYPYGYFYGQLKGLETGSPFLYRNYELDDDRRMLRIHSPVQSIKAPHLLRSFQGSWYQYTPGRVIFVYHNRTRY